MLVYIIKLQAWMFFGERGQVWYYTHSDAIRVA
jgi:hypothetical protein